MVFFAPTRWRWRRVSRGGAVDVDFAADLGEGDEALVAVVLPRLGGDAKELAPNVIYPRLREVIQVVIRDFGK